MQRSNSNALKDNKFGNLIVQLRNENGTSRAQLAVRIGVNPTLLQEIEQGSRMPMDEIIRNLAKHFSLDENMLFELVGRVPLIIREELESQTLLQNVLKEMSKIKLSEEKKQDIYQEFIQIVRRVSCTA